MQLSTPRLFTEKAVCFLIKGGETFRNSRKIFLAIFRDYCKTKGKFQEIEPSRICEYLIRETLSSYGRGFWNTRQRLLLRALTLTSCLSRIRQGFKTSSHYFSGNLPYNRKGKAHAKRTTTDDPPAADCARQKI